MDVDTTVVTLQMIAATQSKNSVQLDQNLSMAKIAQER
jgi:hypothetical protein